MSCQIEQIADCGDLSSLARALFLSSNEEQNWLSQCCVSLSSCGNLLAVGYRNRLCILTTQWISSTQSNTFLISWSGTLPADISTVLVLPICPSHHSFQNGPDWFCIVVGFKNGNIAFHTNTGHLLLSEKIDEKPVLKISCHTGTYGTLPDDVHVLFHTCECIISGATLFPTLRNAKAQLAKVQAGIQDYYSVDNRSISIKKWLYTEQEVVNDAAVVGLELKNAYDHLLAASTYGGYDVWYRSVPPVNTLILGAGQKPYVGFHYALEGGTAPPLQDVARAVAHKIKSALPGWLGGASTEGSVSAAEPRIRSEPLSLRSGLHDAQRHGTSVTVSPDRRLAAVVDSFGRVAVLDVNRGHLIRLIKGCRDAQCAFVQIFELDNKKPQLSFVKEIRRAIFLIIYNPKKGLIDIRLMQRGNRVAVFTATKNGQLLYNTCGLVGADKNYTQKKLNLPEFQCVLLDPDGKLKKFSIPFFYALDGVHSERSKDLNTLKELRDLIKNNTSNSEDYEQKLFSKVSEIKTLELKKHFLEMLIRNYDTSPTIIISCLQIFWDSTKEESVSSQQRETQHYFANLGLLTIFYMCINDDCERDEIEFATELRNFLGLEVNESCLEKTIDNQNEDNSLFHLLEDDSCILERLLVLAHENNYKHHARVTFADTSMTTYKKFISCFNLEEKSKYISLKANASVDKLNNLATITFTSIFKLKNFSMLASYVNKCNIDPKEIVKLLITHFMNMSLEEITIDLVEKWTMAVYHVCTVTKDATNIIYNEISHWWEDIRNVLVEMPCPLRSMIVAMACKVISRILESNNAESDDVWESVTKENAKWGILIGKLEDISILSIVLMCKDTFNGNSLPSLEMDDFNINLKYIYTRGKGSITELIAKWLCSMGATPAAIVANELMETIAANSELTDEDDNDDNTTDLLFVENNRYAVDENTRIFKWLSLLRRQFPLSTSANYIITNMCWEYAMAWQKCMKNTLLLDAVIHCLSSISDIHIRLGLFSIIWATYIKQIFEISCRLVNKVGRLPKDPLCLQDISFDNTTLINFFRLTTLYLNDFQNCLKLSYSHNKKKVEFEKIWEESMPSLVEVTQHTKNVNDCILTLNYQVSCTLYYQCHFNIKLSKPLDVLFDIDYHYILEALTGNVVNREINMKPSEKLRNPRMKFLTKLIRASVETISCSDGHESYRTYDSGDCQMWIEKISILANLWSIDDEFIKRQQVIALYHVGYDTLAENTMNSIRNPVPVLAPILAITIQRLKRSLEHSNNQAEWIVSIPPQLYKRLQNTVLDTSIPAHPSLSTTILVLQKLLFQLNKKSPDPAHLQDIKLIELIIENCEIIIRRKL